MKNERDSSPSARPTNPQETRRWLLRLGLQAGVLMATLLLGIVLLGLAQRVGWLTATGGTANVSTANGSTQSEYTCPMHPEIRQDNPGKCPICGMPLVPLAELKSKSQSGGAKDQTVEQGGKHICPMMCTPPHDGPGKCPVCGMPLVPATSGADGQDTVTIEPAARRIVGIQTATAESGAVKRTIRTIGQLEYDQQRVATIAAYIDGRLEKLFADYVGVKVAKGDDLAVIYSPRLYSAQVEYLTSLETPALDALSGDNQTLAEAARDNLEELGMTDAQIDQLRKTQEAKKRLRITSPITGTVIDKYKVEGDYVKTGEPIYRVAELSTLWLMLDLYPEDASAVRFGQTVEAEVQSLPGVRFPGRVAFVDPIVNEKTRTVTVRVELPNPDGRLKPGDYATAYIEVPVVHTALVYDPQLAGKWISPMHPQIVRDQPGPCPICGMDLVSAKEFGYADEPVEEPKVITVPRSAVLMAGTNSVVYVETQPGVFEMRRVKIGPLTDKRAVILEGIEAGEIVATEGNFLIDSQMQLSGGASLLDPSRGIEEDKQQTNPSASHHH